MAFGLHQPVGSDRDRPRLEITSQLNRRKLLTKLRSLFRVVSHYNIAKPSDQIWIQTDEALKPGASLMSGLATTLFLVREGKVLWGGFFNAKSSDLPPLTSVSVVRQQLRTLSTGGPIFPL